MGQGRNNKLADVFLPGPYMRCGARVPAFRADACPKTSPRAISSAARVTGPRADQSASTSRMP
ncbi:hypothetical protein Hoch_2440 [Haliangium ochraceum DSM 14365]|uniref:Uncharacterized protein n=1 Tax=Haliangium ochraceum (strain DSM 14365 / JCM 11303 / SMP-2) TaxID=502025 RepID=D0LJD0_HALO1|nr:hypothetical protein Hoch_2440 [Haliangium ochraceum DSM 14365]